MNEARQEIITVRNISYPIVSDENELLATVQVESLSSEIPIYNKDDPKAKPKKKTHYQGFSQIDRIVSNLIHVVMKMKMDTLAAQLRREAMQIEVAQSIRIAGRICNQRCKTSLLREIQSSLPEFFGFKEVGLMFRDVKTDMLFTINLLSKDEQEEWVKAQMKQQGYSITSKQQQQQMEILFEQFQETFNISFPNHLGITGKAFKNEKIFISNNPKSDKLFTNEIDNQTCEDNVRNFMIGPVYGHLRDSVTDSQAFIDFEEDLSE